MTIHKIKRVSKYFFKYSTNHFISIFVLNCTCSLSQFSFPKLRALACAFTSSKAQSKSAGKSIFTA